MGQYDKIASEQNIAQAIIQAGIEATKAAIMVVREADNMINNARSIHTMPTSVWPNAKADKI